MLLTRKVVTTAMIMYREEMIDIGEFVERIRFMEEHDKQKRVGGC